ncbi:hypothetical protein GGI25_002733 [Coemansia spiralis]|uniref:HMG box domain-containing protein n=2 Tax=Coemansia TaxID=4863 RepID=A0A9W8G8A9_9FUNG|nr:hypothetical protein EDC05_002146 [Coemansia umbellata]KAJ2625237.1 hypothetical protein GGI26_000707 [Coemansia sp. RSA 1358]KAJ2677943.1 hypothetical protein GGI25_002733 [Coemansia spiralis]
MSNNLNDGNTLGQSQVYGLDLSSIFSQELNGVAVAPTPISVTQPPANVLVNRVPDGFTPILINLQRCSRAELRKFLHNMLCNNNNSVDYANSGTNNGSTVPKEKPLGRCGCELLEFDYQPDFLFGKRGQHQDDIMEEGDDEYSNGSCSDYDDDGNLIERKSKPDSNHDKQSDNESSGNSVDQEEERWRAIEAERNRIKIKRPPNSFMIYRSERHNELVKEYRGGNKVISGIIAKEWHNMSAEVKKKYEDLAAIKKREHELLYPNYKFMPKRRKL